MGLSKAKRMWILLVIDVSFFLVELIVGYSVHSLALVADAFHMLNDVISLCISIWALRVAGQRADSRYTYGLQRSEVLGALINGVFLVALCVSIFLEAIKRFFQPQVVSNPLLVLVVGCCGLASNIVGLFLFHDHSGHDHGGGGAGHAHGHGDELAEAEAGETSGPRPSVDHKLAPSLSAASGDGTVDVPVRAYTNGSAASARGSKGHLDPAAASSGRSHSPLAQWQSPRGGSHHRRNASSASVRPLNPAEFQNQIIQAGWERGDDLDSSTSTEGDAAGEPTDADESEASSPAHEGSSLLGHSRPRASYIHSDLTPPPDARLMDGAADARPGRETGRSTSMDHHRHKHRQTGSTGNAGGGHGGHGHGHEDLNMRGVFLHVLGDALGNVGVIATALFIWLTHFGWRFYMDPLISLLIAGIILRTALPLCRASARILLQAVPAGLSVDDIRADIEQLPGVEACHHLHVWQLSGAKLVASLHVRLACDYSGFGCGHHGGADGDAPESAEKGARRYMRLAQAVRTCLHEYGIHSSTIQPEFCLDARHDRVRRRSGGPRLGDGAGGDDGDDGDDGGGGGGGSGTGRVRRALGALRVRTTPAPAQDGGKRLPTISSRDSSPRDACLMECDAGCTAKKCCVSPGERDEGGH